MNNSHYSGLDLATENSISNRTNSIKNLFDTIESITYNIVIADNQYLIVESLKILLGREKKFCIKGVVKNQLDLREILNSEYIDLLVVDYNSIEFEGIEDLLKLKSQYPGLSVLILTNNICKNELASLVKANFNNILCKTATKDEFFAAIEASLKGKNYYSSELMDLILNKKNEIKYSTTSDKLHLTSTEIEIIRLITNGLSTKEIALLRHISFHTVMSHRKNIFKKLGINSSTELLKYAYRAGIMDSVEYHI